MLKSTYKPAPAAPAPPPLLPGWTEHKAPTGHTYYYNAETKKSTYQRPVALPEPVQPQPPVHQHYGQNAFPGAPYQAGFPPQYQQQFPVPHHGGRGGFRGGHGYQDRRRHQPEDRPKHKHAIPGCAPWVLVKTKLGRRFVHNPETKESFWKFPPDVMKGVVEFDRIERDKKERKERGEPSDVEDEQAAAAELAAADEREGSGARPSVTPAPASKDYDSEEYEEVEVTDDEEADEEDGPSKRQKTEEEGEDAVEFDEDDIAWQLQAMGEDYGLDPGEYGDIDDDLPEGAEGLPLTEEDAKALFRDLLDDHNCNPFSTWDKIIDEGRIIDDDRYTALTTMKARKETWEEWSRDKAQALKEQREKAAKEDPAIPYLAFLHKYATPKLYWPEFRRKYKKEAEMKNTKLLDKDREKWYREHISRLKLPESTRKSDLSNLLKSLPVTQLNRSTSMASLPSVLLRDLRFISLPISVRDPMVEAYISTLPPAPEASNKSSEDLEEAERKKQDRERREKALADRERRVQEEKRRQQRDQAYGKGRLREEEEELRRAMKISKDGLRAQLGGVEEKDGEKEGEKAE
ncbi:ff domain protein [Diplodia corticola]|uniref:Ff domain protein n=1 Tax=Diplodia corticola TaxID=236234 RepID=A0A1J9R1A8_9PEZI|nr:ff domain protein [Diplodia corticola]OJD34034.1 ff domain protein [Diplodia corticola]